MFKKTVSYVDYNDEEQTKTLYFNLTKSELIEMETEENGGFSEMLKRIVAEKDGNKIMKVFKKLILKSYGVKTPDGQGFDKSEEVLKSFEYSAAYDALFIELCTNAEAASEFIAQIMSLNDEQRKSLKDKASVEKLTSGE